MSAERTLLLDVQLVVRAGSHMRSSLHMPSSSTVADPPPGTRDDTIIGLLRRLTDDLTKLFRQEAALASAEFLRSLTNLGKGVAAIAVAGVLLFAGVLVLLAAAVLALALVLPPWAAALIVGGCVVAIGLVLLQLARPKLNPAALKPSHSVRSLQMDKEVIARHVSS
jgi:hypothetical protein